MPYELINTQEAVKLFHQLLQPNSQIKVLRLVGATKIGKSYLLTKVFPQVAHELYQARLAIIDLRNPTHSIPDFLNIASWQLGDQACAHYVKACNDWASRPKVEVKGLLAKFANISITSKDSIDDALDRDRYLVTHFLNDLAKLDDKLLLLFFDSVDCSTKAIQTWLLAGCRRERSSGQVGRFVSACVRHNTSGSDPMEHGRRQKMVGDRDRAGCTHAVVPVLHSG